MIERVPRYTSYPTAPHFHKEINAKQYVAWLDSIEENASLSLYFHIPYCKKLCWFCGCHTKAINHYEPITRYLNLLKQEVKLVTPHLKDTLLVKHIHFGGGSPTMIAAEDFVKFMILLREQFNFAEKIEIAIEIDPRTVDTDKIIAYKQAGITRASLGVQDFNQKVQKAINRIQPYKMVEDAVNSLRTHGIDKLNIDLIYGLPFQSLETIRDSIELTLLLNPCRVALFGYAHVPWIKNHQKLIPEEALPNKEERIAMSEYASSLLLEAGYIAVGFDHFAKPEDELAKAAKSSNLRRNFQGYTTDNASSLLGFGISAISSFSQGYTQNSCSNIEYEKLIKAKEFATFRGVYLTEEDMQRRDIIMSLMCNMSAIIEKKLYSKELERLTPYIAAGDVHFENEFLTVHPTAQNKLRLIASVFDGYLSTTAHRYSQSV